MDVERLANDREEDSIRKTICENASDAPIPMNDAKEFWILLSAADRCQNFVDQLLAETGTKRPLRPNPQPPPGGR
jgi:hypothetical protein